MKIGFENQYAGYEKSLVMSVLRQIAGDRLEITVANKADLVIIGPFTPRKHSRIKRILRTLRGQPPAPSPVPSSSALRLFHTSENVRHNAVDADYALSFDLDVASERHFRLPLWMESIDWSHEGISNTPNPRVARLLSIAQLMQPLGRSILERPRSAALVTSHLNHPRRALFDALSKIMPTKGYGRGFDRSIAGHNESGFAKDVLLRDFAVNLCPENALHPGYYTEKIAEAYGAGCLPVSWADPDVRVDFNPAAFVNALDFAETGYEAGLRQSLTPESMAAYAEQPLLLEKSHIEPLVEFLKTVLADAR